MSNGIISFINMSYLKKSYPLFSAIFKRIIVLIEFLLLFAAVAEGSNIDQNLNLIPVKWPGNKEAAITFTFDDGYLCQFTKGITLLKKNNFPATFFVITGFVDKKVDGLNWSIVRNAALQGYEIGSHTVNHKNLILLEKNKYNLDSLRWEVLNSQTTINHQVPTQKCLSFCYPRCLRDKTTDKIVADYYIGARSSGFCEGFSPANLYAVKGLVIHTYHVAPELNWEVDNTIKKTGWLVEMIHGIDKDGWEPVSYKTYDKHFSYIKEKENQLWVATFQNVIKYIRERQDALFSDEEILPDRISFHITEVLPDDIYNYPLSIKMDLPDNTDIAEFAIQNQRVLNLHIYNDGINKYIIIDGIIPDKGQVTVYLKHYNSDSINTGIKPNFATYFEQNQRNLVIHNINNVEVLEISILNMNGVVVQNSPVSYLSDQYEINLGLKSKGIYLAVIKTRKGNIVRKFVNNY